MATTVTYQCYQSNAQGTTIAKTGTQSLADVTVRTTPTSTGGFNTASVTADVSRLIYVNAVDAAAAGVDEGWYEHVTGTTFRKQPF